MSTIKHNPARNGHCSGCTDPQSEGTHQMGTFEHPDEAPKDKSQAELLAEKEIPWDQATTDALGLSYDGVYNTRDIARAAFVKGYAAGQEARSARTDKIRGAAQALINRWDSPQWEWDKHGGTANLIADLRNALSELEAQAEQDAGMTDLSETELWALIWKRWPAKGQDTMTPELRQGAHDFYVYLREQGRLPKGRASEGDDAATSKHNP